MQGGAEAQLLRGNQQHRGRWSTMDKNATAESEAKHVSAQYTLRKGLENTWKGKLDVAGDRLIFIFLLLESVFVKKENTQENNSPKRKS